MQSLGRSIKEKSESTYRFCSDTATRSSCNSKGANGILRFWKCGNCCSLCSKSTRIKAHLHYWFWCSSWEWNKWCILWWCWYILPFNSPSKLWVNTYKLVYHPWLEFLNAWTLIMQYLFEIHMEPRSNFYSNYSCRMEATLVLVKLMK